MGCCFGHSVTLHLHEAGVLGMYLPMCLFTCVCTLNPVYWSLVMHRKVACNSCSDTCMVMCGY
jgi:hypothetical protein